MKLGRIAAAAGADAGEAADTQVTGFAIDHRKVAPGTVFGAFKGARVNGEDIIPAAVAAGAVAVVARPEAHVQGALHISDEEPRRAFAQAAAADFLQQQVQRRGRAAHASTLPGLRMPLGSSRALIGFSPRKRRVMAAVILLQAISASS